MENNNNALINSNPSDRVVGCRQVIRELSQGNIRCVYVARDVDAKTAKLIRDLISTYHPEVHWVKTRAGLGEAVGIDVGATIVGMLSNKN